MAVFNLHKTDHKDGSYGLHPQHTYYTEDYAERMCSFYLTDELYRNDKGSIDTYYRLHSPKIPHDNNQALIYDVHCPKCGSLMKQITTNMDYHTLGYYECKKCNHKGGYR